MPCHFFVFNSVLSDLLCLDHQIFILFIILYVAETKPPAIYCVDILTAVWIISYTCRDIGTGELCYVCVAQEMERN